MGDSPEMGLKNRHIYIIQTTALNYLWKFNLEVFVSVYIFFIVTIFITSYFSQLSEWTESLVSHLEEGIKSMFTLERKPPQLGHHYRDI